HSLFYINPPRLRSTLFPYTTLFRSRQKVFSSELKQLCLDFALPAPGAVTRYNAPLVKTSSGFSAALLAAEQSLFEKLLLFDTVQDRKSTRLNSSHVSISYAVFCVKK